MKTLCRWICRSHGGKNMETDAGEIRTPYLQLFLFWLFKKRFRENLPKPSFIMKLYSGYSNGLIVIKQHTIHKRGFTVIKPHTGYSNGLTARNASSSCEDGSAAVCLPRSEECRQGDRTAQSRIRRWKAVIPGALVCFGFFVDFFVSLFCFSMDFCNACRTASFIPLEE